MSLHKMEDGNLRPFAPTDHVHFCKEPEAIQVQHMMSSLFFPLSSRMTNFLLLRNQEKLRIMQQMVFSNSMAQNKINNVAERVSSKKSENSDMGFNLMQLHVDLHADHEVTSASPSLSSPRTHATIDQLLIFPEIDTNRSLLGMTNQLNLHHNGSLVKEKRKMIDGDMDGNINERGKKRRVEEDKQLKDKRCGFVDGHNGERCGTFSIGKSGLCKRHGGGKRCAFEGGCDKAAQGATMFCVGHGGGKRCAFEGCTKLARGKSNFCIPHGGGKRCSYEMEVCDKLAQGGTNYCIKHGGGRRCKHVEKVLNPVSGEVISAEKCEKSAVSNTNFCVGHGGGKRCEHLNCEKSAVGGQFCVKHGGSTNSSARQHAS